MSSSSERARVSHPRVGFGFMMGVSPREPIGRFAELTRMAEGLGFDMAWVADSQLYTKDAFVALTLAATGSRTIRLGPGVTNPVTRNLTVLANTMTALNEVSGGRAVMGIGTGDASVFPLGLRATLGELRHAVEGIRALTAGHAIDVSGHEIRLGTGGQRVPIFVSASQPGMLRLAGAVADGVILMGAAVPELTQWQLDRIAEGAAVSGRSLADVCIDLWFAISISDDRAQALRDVRPWATSQARWFARWKALPAPLQPFAEDFRRAEKRHDFARHLARGADEPDQVSDAFVDWIGVTGSLDACVRKIRPLLGLKIDRITFSLLPGGRQERLRQYGEALIPRLRACEREAATR
jgi:5,10-methylenetetrahydromethanopterin reductase